jgi:hypothetical protein
MSILISSHQHYNAWTSETQTPKNKQKLTERQIDQPTSRQQQTDQQTDTQGSRVRASINAVSTSKIFVPKYYEFFDSFN